MYNRIMNIAEKAFDQLLTSEGIKDDGTLKKSFLQVAYDNIDINHESKMSDEDLFNTYYDWFKDGLEMEGRF